jgi:hypothetical protein
MIIDQIHIAPKRGLQGCTSLAIYESYRPCGKNARYDLVIVTSQFFSNNQALIDFPRSFNNS